jgi:tRNA dimethylallyltransferase
MDGFGLTAKRAILIAGPTASGKSAVAITLAEQLGGVVINADSMQVYADLDVLTARPSAGDLTRVPHRLFGHIDAAETYSVGRWLTEVEQCLAVTWGEGRIPVLVGGTGLYFKALTQGLSAIPLVPEVVRARLRTEAEGRSADELHATLAARDPIMAARLRPTDPQRILRALEVFEATGRSLSTFQAVREPPILPSDRCAGVFFAPERAVLNAQIDRRFDRMIDEGAVDEVARLGARQLDPVLPAMRALGVPPLLVHLAGDLPLAEAVDRGKLLTRQYAKRQMTFARHQLPDLDWVAPADALASLEGRWAALSRE